MNNRKYGSLEGQLCNENDRDHLRLSIHRVWDLGDNLDCTFYLFIFFLKMFLFILGRETERERACVQVGGGAEAETPKQTPCLAQSSVRGGGAGLHPSTCEITT